MTIDTSVALARMHTLNATMSSLGSALETAAPSGDFQGVLDQVSAALDGASSSTSTSDSATDDASLGASLGSALDLASVLDTSDSSLDPSDSSLDPSDTTLDTALGALGAGASVADSSGAGSSSVTGADVVADAERYLGVPYQWGGTSPSTGFDCSGLVQHVYGDLGISLPRTSQEQATVGTPVASLSDAQPGDLVFFEPGPDGPGHVGIYIGNGEMIDAPHTGTDVQVQPVGQPSAIRRILPSASTSGSATSEASGTIPSDIHVPASLEPLFSEAGARYNVSPALLAAVAQQESGFNPNAVSSAGAEGIMQLMPSTAAGLGVNAFDPAQAIDGAAQLLGGYLQQYNGSVPLALAAYNAGPGAVAKYGGVPPYPETTSYINNIVGMLGGSS